MNLTHVRTFLEVVETGNLNRAAEHLHVSQSTVTARINALEQLLGQKLLHRNKAGATMTAQGHKFLRHAKGLLQLWSMAQHDMALPKNFEDVIAFACPESLWHGAGEIFIDYIRTQQKSLAVTVQFGTEAEIKFWQDNGLIDCALSYEPQIVAGFTTDRLFSDELRQYSTVPRQVIRWDENYVFVDYGEEFRRRHTNAYPVEETAAISFNRAEYALSYILGHGGSAYLPERIAATAVDNEELFEIGGAAEFVRHVYFTRNTLRTEDWLWLTQLQQEIQANGFQAVC